MSFREAMEFFSTLIVRVALRSGREFSDGVKSVAESFSPESKTLIGLEFLILNVHFLEREMCRLGYEQHFDRFMEPVRQLTLFWFGQATRRGITELEQLEPWMDIWDSALQAYNSQQDFYREPLTSGSKQSVSGQFGTRLAKICGESEFSIIAAMGTNAVGAMLIANAETKLIQKTLESINWNS